MQEHKFESLEEVKTKIATNYSLLKSKHTSGKAINMENTGNENDETTEEFNVELDSNAMCPKHSLPIHSYMKNNKSLLCSECIKSDDIEQSRYKPIIQVIKSVRGEINSKKLKLNQSIFQIKRFKQHMDKVKENNIRTVTEGVNNHFRKITKILDQAKELAIK